MLVLLKKGVFIYNEHLYEFDLSNLFSYLMERKISIVNLTSNNKLMRSLLVFINQTENMYNLKNKIMFERK